MSNDKNIESNIKNKHNSKESVNETNNSLDINEYCFDSSWITSDNSFDDKTPLYADNPINAKKEANKAVKKKTVITSIHKDHRKRVRNKIIKYGIETFTEFEVLEALLFYAIPLKDTNPIAHRLIEKFGSLKNVLSADYDELIEVDGISEVSASLLIMHREISKYIRTKSAEEKYLLTSDMVGQFCCNYFGSHLEESFIALSMTSARKLIAVDVISRGTENETAFYSRKFLKTILKNKCTTVILAHNHPDGIVVPSNEDMFLTNKFAATLKEFGISIIDHIICNGSTYVSMSDRGMLQF